MRIPFGEVDWTDEVLSPFGDMPQYDVDKRWGGRKAITTEPRAVARKFNSKCRELFYDGPKNEGKGEEGCVIVGKQGLNTILPFQKYYVLIVVLVGQDGNCCLYERVAVGIIEGQYIALETSGETVIIQ